jgi:uncharacterized protein YyaL (SSP411 family)
MIGTVAVKNIIRNTLDRLHLLRDDHRDARGLAHFQASGPVMPVAPAQSHLERAIAWLKRAQDAVPRGGVSWGYVARTRYGSPAPVGWRSAYPETTGYIIETLIRYGDRFADTDAVARARRMADWETAVQLPDGSIQGGRIDASPVAGSTFVTGQVIFGWVAAYRRFNESSYLETARRAGDWLLACLDDEGRFVRGYSHFCKPGPKAYEARTGWSLALLGQATGENKYTEAARRMSHYALSCRRPNGWFAENDLEDHDQPLTHTTGYVLEGVLETGLLTGEPSFVEAVSDSVEKLSPLVTETGFLAGRWREDWTPAVDWVCLTGSAQIALVCLRLNELRPNPARVETARRLLSFVSATALTEGYHPGLLGGIHGSWPFSGGYGQYCVLNWATKFYSDAVMLWLATRETPMETATKSPATA